MINKNILTYFYGKSRIRRHVTRSSAAILQSPLTPISRASSSTANIQRVRGLPRSRRPLSGFLLNIVFAGRSSGILATCPAHCNLPCFIRLTISTDLYTWYTSWFMRLRQTPFSSLQPRIERKTLRSKTPRARRSASFNVHASWP